MDWVSFFECYCFAALSTSFKNLTWYGWIKSTMLKVSYRPLFIIFVCRKRVYMLAISIIIPFGQAIFLYRSLGFGHSLTNFPNCAVCGLHLKTVLNRVLFFSSEIANCENKSSTKWKKIPAHHKKENWILPNSTLSLRVFSLEKRKKLELRECTTIITVVRVGWPKSKSVAAAAA